MKYQSNNFLRIIGFLTLLFALSGCAVMDKAACTQANWNELGKMDAFSGRNKFSSRAQACQEHGLGADQFSYERGMQAGLIAFCTAASGSAHGQNGGYYSRGFCPSSTEADFLSGYTPAYEKYRFQTRMKNLQSEISHKNHLLSNELDKKDRNHAEIDRLRREIRLLKNDMHMEIYMRAIH
ncbi:DUF2799 domain-containing protein [Acidovorax sp. Be4]|uniref:DUF2799 domain-containing protein n=1 Tax=Acidovorax bellezanensis TaxID=2976702 RepID=A0ABT2PKG5_9BURK|nr:DUF2799 domain-containing protein [Acidovorax sp. Be4]MCT9809737.1 DUF2799 domain-containing protein [Acidovorax sp. Be4]